MNRRFGHGPRRPPSFPRPPAAVRAGRQKFRRGRRSVSLVPGSMALEMAKKAGTPPKPRPSSDELPTLSFPSQAAWQKWLAKHHQTSRGIWLKFAKKASGVSSVYYPQALEVALCYGWIDGQVRRLDDTHY